MVMQTSADTTVGLDVGGTRIRAARISREGQMGGRIAEPVVTNREGFKAQVLRLIDTVRDETTKSVGIGIPGRVAGYTGAIHSAGYLDIAGENLIALVRAAADLPCRVENDATMALIAEGRGTSGLIAMITVGTGVGGALLRDGSPFYGSDFAGQFGHMVVAADGPVCNCGRQGCIETFSAGRALGDLISKAGLSKSTVAADLLTAAESGDTLAKDIIAQWSEPMKRAIQSLVAIVDPAQVILGGGLGIDMARALSHNTVESEWFDRPLTAARLGDDAGVIGAGLAGFFELKAE